VDIEKVLNYSIPKEMLMDILKGPVAKIAEFMGGTERPKEEAWPGDPSQGNGLIEPITKEDIC